VSDKRRGLGRGLGALIPSATPVARTGGDRPVDVFFPERDANASSAPVPGPSARSGGTTESGTASSGGSTDQPVEGGTGGAAPSGESDLVPVPGARFAEIPVDSIVPNSKQPRQVFDEEALAELVHSVREIGVLQPIVVRELPLTGTDQGARFELIMGERRWRAAKQAGLELVPAIIRDTSDDDMLRDALLENLHRSQLNPLEEAAAYQQLLDDFGCTHDELAGRIGRSRPQISNTIRLLKLPPQVQRRVAAGVISAGHARALLGLDDLDSMDALALRIVAEGLSVRAVEEIVALGEGQPHKSRAKKPRAGAKQPELTDLASRLGDRLDTRVTITLGRTKGKLSVDFASVEDLNRILRLISPD
jgi:ParB family chromosome partitioning protein